MGGVGRLRAVATAALSTAVVTALATTTWAAPASPTPTPVRDDPGFLETAPVSVGPWFGWQREEIVSDATRPPDFFVEREGREAVRVNAPGTRVETGGGIVGSDVFFTQYRRNITPRLMRYDLRSNTRTAMPDAVNRARFNRRPTTIVGDVSADGPWLLFTRDVGLRGEPENIQNRQVVLYHRATRKTRVLNNVNLYDFIWTSAGQVNGNYVTWTEGSESTDNVATSSVTRHHITTGRTKTVSYRNALDLEMPHYLAAPAVAEDGTMYFWRSRQVSEDDAENSLVRLPLGGPREVVITLSGSGPRDTFVRGRADGTHRIFYTDGSDIFRLDPGA